MHIIVAENIRSAHNVGNIIRTADALGRDVCLTGYSPHPSQESKVSKTSLGAENHVRVLHYWNTKDAIIQLRQQGYQCIGAETGGISIENLGSILKTGKPIALRVGNEVDGLLTETRSLMDHIISIPMRGVKESLNVSQASAICMWVLSSKN